MGYIISMLFLFVLCAIAVIVGRSLRQEPPEITDPNNFRQIERNRNARVMRTAGTWTIWTAIGLFLLIFTITTLVRSFHSVDTGHVGVVYQFGSITDQTGEGFVQTWPWQDLKQANVQVQRAHFENLASFSEETQDVFIAATLNYRVDDRAVQDLYREVGPNYFEKLIPSRVNQLFKDETVKYKAVNIAPKREAIRQTVRTRLVNDPILEKYSITVEDLLIDNIRFSEAFTQAIENKQIATQDAQTAQNRVKQAEFEAQQLIEKAQGEAAAYRLRQKNLTPLLVQQNAIDKLNDNIQILMLPSGSNFLFPGSLLQAQGGSQR